MTQEQRREQLIKVTLRLIGRYGVAGTSTARIAAAAGVTEPTLYRYFGSRKDLLLAAFAVIHEEAMQQILFSEKENALERLREIGEKHNRDILARRPGPHENQVWEFTAASASLGLKDVVIKNHRRLIEALAKIVDEGKAQGTIRRDVDSLKTAWRVMGFFFLEDLAHSLHAQDEVLSGLSLEILDSFLEEIAEKPGI